MVREAIIENIVTTLGDITTGNGYNNDIGVVTREQLNWAGMQPKNYPAAMVVWVTDEKNSDGAHYQHVWSELRVVIRGVVYAKNDIEQALNKFAEDIEKVLSVDPTRGGNAIYTIPDKITAYGIMEDYYLVFDYEFLVAYQYVYGNP